MSLIHLSRLAGRLVLCGSLVLTPLGLTVWSAVGLAFYGDLAFAESGPGRDGDDRDDDRDDRDDDRDDREDERDDREDDRDDERDDREDDRDDDRDDDDDDDNSGPGNSNWISPTTSTNQTTQSPGSSDNHNSVGPSNNAQRVTQNLHLRYSNGWQEWVRDGRYRLIDPQGRTVSDRRATANDLARMRTAAGL